MRDAGQHLAEASAESSVRFGVGNLDNLPGRVPVVRLQ